MSKHEFLAELQHSDLKHGQFVVRIEDKWWVGDLTAVDYSIRANELTEITIKGYLKEDRK